MYMINVYDTHDNSYDEAVLLVSGTGHLSLVYFPPNKKKGEVECLGIVGHKFGRYEIQDESICPFVNLSDSGITVLKQNITKVLETN